MQALVYYGTKDIRLEDFPEQQNLGRRDVRLQVKCAALCHTDFNEYLHGPLYISKTPHPRSGRSIPLVIGHEFSGEVVEVGPGRRDGAVGGPRRCKCRRFRAAIAFLHRGLYELCQSAAYIGFDRDGGIAESAVVPETLLSSAGTEDFERSRRAGRTTGSCTPCGETRAASESAAGWPWWAAVRSGCAFCNVSGRLACEMFSSSRSARRSGDSLSRWVHQRS